MVWASNHFIFPNSVFVELRIWRWYHCADTHLHNTIFHLWGVYDEGAAFTVVVSSLCSISYHCHSTIHFHRRFYKFCMDLHFTAILRFCLPAMHQDCE